MAAGATHEVLNQPPPLVDINLFTGDLALQEAVVRDGAAWAVEPLDAFGARLDRAESFELGRLANAYPPVLHAFDRAGRRRDEAPTWREPPAPSCMPRWKTAASARSV